MASLALGVAGAAVGSYFGPLGTSIGWGLGAYLGGALGAKKGPKPEVKDLRVQTSELGTPIPIGYGTIRIAGFLMWAADRVPHTTKSSGKGGPKVTTTTYTDSFAIGLLETSFLDGVGALINNPIIGILRIWANGRLVYGEGTSPDALPMQIYYGTEDQEADPTIESYEGVGNVSGERGKAYVVFTDLPLGPYGEALPNFTFEVIASGSIALKYFAKWDVDWSYAQSPGGDIYSYPWLLNGIETVNADGNLVVHRYRSGADYGAPTGVDNEIYYDRRTYKLTGELVAADAQVITAFPADIALNASSNSSIAYVSWQEGHDCTGYGGIFTTINTFAWMLDGGITFQPLNDDWSLLCPAYGGGGFADFQLPITSNIVYWHGYVYASGRYSDAPGSAQVIRRWPAPDGAVYTNVFDPTATLNVDAYRTGYPTGSNSDDGAILTVGDDGYLYALVSYTLSGDGSRLFRLDADLNVVKVWWSGSGANLPSTAGEGYAIWRGHIVSYRSSGVVATGSAQFSMLALNANGTTTFTAEIPPYLYAPSPLFYIGGNKAAVRDGILQFASDGITLAEMVANVSQHMGYADTQYNVEQLTDIVRGACISQRTTGRAAIESWQPAYQFGAVESNFQVKFVKWSGDVQATITAADLGFRELGTEPGDPIKKTYTQDKDLPRIVEVVFLNINRDYQEGMQYDEDVTLHSDIHVALSLAIVLNDPEAKRIAEVTRANALIERTGYAISLPRRLAHLEPTDVIDLLGSPVRITAKEEIGYTHVELQGVETATDIFLSAPVAPAAPDFVPQSPPIALNKTDLALLDYPLISDTDFANGYYGALAGRMAGEWAGASLLKSVDGGVNYGGIASIVSADTFGVATTVLGDWTDGDVFDESNTVTVRLSPGSGTLASSNELGVLNGANMAALGEEIIHFKTAELVAARTYILSGLLRGRRGTNRSEVMGGHALDDLFVLLPCHNIEGVFSEIGQERLYKAVTTGALLSSASAVAFTNTGIALKCYAPCELGGGRNGAGDLTLNWTPRTRIGGAWVDGNDAPLSEATELYNVAIYSDNTYTTIVRTFLPVTNTQVYLASDQVIDFGSPQATVYWDVDQMGALGDGYITRGVS